MRALIDARVSAERDGGIAQALVGLARGFAEVDRHGLDVTFALAPDSPPELENVAAGVTSVRLPAGSANPVRRLLALSRTLRALKRSTDSLLPWDPTPNPVGDHGFDVVHLAIQNGFATGLPYVYSPHDLQHLHLPQLFRPVDRRKRARQYERLIKDAAAVTVMTSWTAEDVCRRMSVDPSLVYVIPHGVRRPSKVDPAAAAIVKSTLGPPFSAFALYPAQTWPHKNHLGLLRALALLRDRGIEVPLVCTGGTTVHQESIKRTAQHLGLQGTVRFTGFVSDASLEALYGMARCLVFPSLFEGFGMPIFDALARGLPVATSDRCGLGSMLEQCAFVFDPLDDTAMAEAIRRAWLADRSGARCEAGRRLVAPMTWDSAARSYAALYRRIAGAPPAPDDEAALSRAERWRAIPPGVDAAL